MNIDDASAARSLSALGHEARLRVFRLLVRAGEDGLKVGEIVKHLGLPASTMAHHLSALVQAGLVLQERQGREIINRADFAATTALASFLTEECCAGVSQSGEEAA